MKFMVILVVILPLIAFQTIIVSPSTSCTCSQFLYQNGCNQQTLGQCSWVTTTNTCVQATCDQMTTIQECLIAKNRCYWNGANCLAFEQCAKLTAQKGLICPEQNIQCYGINENNECQQISALPKCSTYGPATCGLQGGYAGSDGICAYENNSCIVATECSQLTTPQACNKYIQNACIWNNTTGSCSQATCAGLTIATCKFVVTNLDPNQTVPCFWSNNQCAVAGSQLFLDQNQCQANTLLNYRWVGYQNSGVCVSCAKQLFRPANKCSCQQIINETDCNSSQYCTWTNGECNDVSCQSINNQLQCSENTNCYWNIANQNCSTFTSCQQLVGTNSLLCAIQSTNCPTNFNKSCSTIMQQCSSVPSNQCNGMYSINGYCYYDNQKNTCNALTSCTSIKNENICNQLAQLCIWNKTSCTSVTCDDLKTEKKCTYVAKGLSNTDVQVCNWNGKACVTASNILTLSQGTCASSTNYLYYYTGSKCVKCNSFQISGLQNQCNCTQLYYMNDCQSNKLCQWNYNQCTPLLCYAIPEQDICIQNLSCQWTEIGCSNFRACPSLIGTNQKECLAQSLNCPNSDGVLCQNKYFLQPCYTIIKQSDCINTLGSNGICQWSSSDQTCQVISTCGNISNQKNCGIYQYACNWKDGVCTSSSCASFTTVEQCKFYYSSINSQHPISCYWNTDKGTCNQAGNYLTSFASTTCYANSGKTARWNNLSPQVGVCISCSQKYVPNPWKCSCNQIISQANCFQNQLCFWSPLTLTCQESECASLSESVCVTSTKCMWSTKGCVDFTSCSQIKGTSNDECLTYSLYCPYSSKSNSCVSLKSLPSCEDYKTQDQCQGLKGIGQQMCSWSYTINKCSSFRGCYSLNEADCYLLPFLCFWGGFNCQNMTCSNHLIKQSCTYVFDALQPNYIQQCQWENGICQNSRGLQQLDAQTCFSNSDGTSRWSSQSPTDGFCIPCGLPRGIVKYSNKCICNQIVNQSECIPPYCQWNQNYCSDNACYNIYNQFTCLQQQQCSWSLQYNQCSSIGDTVQFCQTLKGNSSLECLAQSGNCPVSLYGICQDRSHLQTCSSMATQNTCTNSIGQEGYCTFTNQACQVITTCSQISTYNLCVNLRHACQWNSDSNTCSQLLCQNITEQSECTFIQQSLNNTTIQYCEWINNACSTVTLVSTQDKTLNNCYSSTGGTYHWSNTLEDGYCVTCTLNLVTMPKTCSCDQLSTAIECSLSSPRCRLNEANVCVEMPCNSILDSMNCSQVSNCMWQNGSCTTFTSCSDITGSSVFDCLAQSGKCPGISNGKCQSQSSLSSCSSYSTQPTCLFGMSASDGFCYWNSTNCVPIQDCMSLTNISQCDSLQKICNWSPYFNKCSPQKCQDYTIKGLCTYVIVNIKNPYVEICEWQNQICQPYTGKYYRFDEQTCYENSAHTYRWVKDDKLGSKCQECKSQVLTFIMSLFIIFMIHF